RHVPVVELHHLVEWNLAGSQHLPETGHPGLQVETSAGPAVDIAILVEDQRPGSDKAHVADKDVYELWEIVKAEACQQATSQSDPWIVRGLEHAWVRTEMLIQVGELLLAEVCVHGHRPELPDTEDPVAGAHALLPEEHRASRIELDQHGNCREQ